MTQESTDRTDELLDETRARDGQDVDTSDEAANAQRPAEGSQGQEQPPSPPPAKNIMLRRTGEADEEFGDPVPVDPEKPELGTRRETRKVAVYAKPVAPGKLNIGMSAPIIMPPVEQQQEGWYEPRAGEIIQNFPDRYIRVQPKGGK
jgi:hypothetical protein